MYVYDGPLYWALKNAPHLFALVMAGALLVGVRAMVKHFSWRGLGYGVLYVVICLALIAAGYVLVTW